MRWPLKRVLTSNIWLTASLLLALTAGCGGGGDSSQTTTAQKAAPAKQAAPAVDAATAATVTGRVVFDGPAPKMAVIDVSSELSCHQLAESHPVMDESVVVNDNGTLRNAFVYVKSGLEGKSFPAPTEPVVLDQHGCTYIPHVIGIQVGQPLKVKNSDEGVLHNIHAFSEGRNGFNFGMPRVMESTKSFKKAEVMVRIKCDVHTWMSSYAGVVDHPYHAVTGADGTFKLSPLPPGEYVIETWHEKYGTQTQTVTVTQKESKEITFTFKPAS